MGTITSAAWSTFKVVAAIAISLLLLTYMWPLFAFGALVYGVWYTFCFFLAAKVAKEDPSALEPLTGVTTPR